ncbi:MAG: aldo/keto reductase [Erythrobacter sp.]|nr:aldo/keto reductase [Erythrobacter sp.]
MNPDCNTIAWQKRELGSSGIAVAPLSLGCNNFGLRLDYRQSNRVIFAALDVGINAFDTANIYGDGKSEEFLGQALAERRSEVVIATKFGRGDAIPSDPREYASYARNHCEQSLRRLRTDHVDLFQLHRFPPDLDIELVLETFEDLKRRGMIRSYGCSDPRADQLRRSRKAARASGAQGFSTMQVERSLLASTCSQELYDEAADGGVSILPYYPLAGGFLTGKYLGDERIERGRLSEPKFVGRFDGNVNRDFLRDLASACQRAGTNLLTVALGYLLSDNSIPTVIAGASTAEHVQQNAAAVRAIPDAFGEDVVAVLARRHRLGAETEIDCIPQ